MAKVWDAQRVQVGKASDLRPSVLRMTAAITVILLVGKTSHWILQYNAALLERGGPVPVQTDLSSWTLLWLGMGLSAMIG
ncbi:hypothetical protein BDP55DRAFT_584931, partial [Colletotrichum godetiae]